MPMSPIRMGGVDPGPHGFRDAVIGVLVFTVGAVAFWLVIRLIT